MEKIDKKEKYYNIEKAYPKGKYVRNDGTITIIKTIRISEEENKIWDSNLIHDFLQGKIANPKKKPSKKKEMGYDILPQNFYNSIEWANKRIEILKRDNFKCRHCDNLANHVDHINSANYFPEIALDNNNLISSCGKCHKIRHL